MPPAHSPVTTPPRPRRRRDDEGEGLRDDDGDGATPVLQAELPPGFVDPITGLPLAEAMRADIELRRGDFRNFTVVVCHPVLATVDTGGSVSAHPTATLEEDHVRIFAEVLRQTLRQKDIVGRYDSRLFLLFLARAKVEEVRIPMERIHANLRANQRGQQQWVDLAFGAAAGSVDASLDDALRTAYADLLRRNVGPAWFADV